MQTTLDECRWLYNRLLEERKVAWDETDTSLSRYQQVNRIPALKKERPSLDSVHSQVLQNVASRVDLAFAAFFRRVKDGEEPGYPRFRGQGRYDSFCYPGSGFTIASDGHHVVLSKIGSVKAVIHRPVAGGFKTCCVSRASTGKWYVCFSCEVDAETAGPAPVSAVGLDVGLTAFATLSDGTAIENPRFLRTAEKALAQAQRRHAKEKKGTAARAKKRKVLARVHERIAHRRDNFAHQAAHTLVTRHGTVAVEDLRVKNMVQNHCVAKSIHDAAWALFIALLAYKAENAGRRYIAVNPAYTTQDCSRCGHRQAMPLSERVYRCSQPDCLLVLPRDVNAARNILRLGLQSLAHTA